MHTLLTPISYLIFWQVEGGQPLLLRSEKIYAVLAVVLVIFVSLLLFMFITQRKVQRLEQLIEEKSNSI